MSLGKTGSKSGPRTCRARLQKSILSSAPELIGYKEVDFTLINTQVYSLKYQLIFSRLDICIACSRHVLILKLHWTDNMRDSKMEA